MVPYARGGQEFRHDVWQTSTNHLGEKADEGQVCIGHQVQRSDRQERRISPIVGAHCQTCGGGQKQKTRADQQMIGCGGSRAPRFEPGSHKLKGAQGDGGDEQATHCDLQPHGGQEERSEQHGEAGWKRPESDPRQGAQDLGRS